MIVDTAVRIALIHDGVEVDALVAQSPEGAVELTVEMLRRHKRMFPGDRIEVERVTDFIKRQPVLPGSWRKEIQI